MFDSRKADSPFGNTGSSYSRSQTDDSSNKYGSSNYDRSSNKFASESRDYYSSNFDNRPSDSHYNDNKTQSKGYYENPFRDDKKTSYSDNRFSDDGNMKRTDSGFDQEKNGPTSHDEKKDKRIQNLALKHGVNNYDPENTRYYHLFNLKKSPYKLQHYMYFSNDLNFDFEVRNYNKLGSKQGRPPELNHYMRFYEMKFQGEFDPKGKQYGSFYTISEDGQGQNIVYNKEYRGVYSNQLDYVNFKISMSQEKQSGIGSKQGL